MLMQMERPQNNHKHVIVLVQISLIIPSVVILLNVWRGEVVMLDVCLCARRCSSSAITAELAATELGAVYWGSDTGFSSNYSAF